MQLKNKHQKAMKAANVSGALAAAACSLLGPSVALAEDAQDGWKVDSAVLYYSEPDRVTAVEPVIAAQKIFSDDSEVKLKVTLDSLTGASHNGAMISDQPQTLTSPSGSAYTVAAGEVPLDESFRDTRTAFNAQYMRLWNRSARWTAGVNFSTEYDFQSVGANAALMWDLNQKNTTLTLGISHEADTVDAVGGIPSPLSMMSNKATEGSADTRAVNDVLLGWTQVVNRRWLMQINASVSSSSGYHNDPYKVVTVYDPSTNAISDYLYESRPDSRTKTALFWENRYHFSEDSMALSYRYMSDDWGITSHTVDAKYRHELSNGWYLQPHVRLYSQTEADFWYESVTPAESVSLTEASADYRLGALDDTTIGLKFGRKLSRGREWNARVELFQQSGDTEAANVDALITQVGYSFYW